MSRFILALVIGAAFGTVSVVRADIDSEMREAAAAVEPAMRDASALLDAGRVDEMDRKILAVFPENSRTPVQSLILGNVLFTEDPKDSYTLHQRAARGLPDQADAQLEWAMEQHRAGEFAAAAESYTQFIKTNPQFAPPLGLLSECLIRTGKTREAVEAWGRSERGHGSLEQFESWVCQVHTHRLPDHDRAALMALAKAGRVDAAEKLIALDCDFPRDWWNSGPRAAYLQNDLELIGKATFKDPRRVAAARCAAECGLIKANGKGDVGAVLRKYGFLIDDLHTLPSDGKLLSEMLNAALSQHVISIEDARQKLGPAILAATKGSHDAEEFNAAAHLYLETDRLPEIDQAGWDATGDARFAASLLTGLASKDALKLDDPRLLKAIKQFPHNAQIARIVVALSQQAGKLDQNVLVYAIEAEFTHFSYGDSPLDFFPRCSAANLRVYFKELSELMKAQVPKGPLG